VRVTPAVNILWAVAALCCVFPAAAGAAALAQAPAIEMSQAPTARVQVGGDAAVSDGGVEYEIIEAQPESEPSAAAAEQATDPAGADSVGTSAAASSEAPAAQPVAAPSAASATSGSAVSQDAPGGGSAATAPGATTVTPAAVAARPEAAALPAAAKVPGIETAETERAVAGAPGAPAPEHKKPQHPAAQEPAPRVPEKPVPWWREAASALGLASDPHPGETAVPAQGPAQNQPDYVIGAGDQLGISAWRDESLTRLVVVLPDGKISFPLVGEVTAAGKTVAQLKAELEQRLARYVTDSGLTVEVKQSTSMIFYTIGRVNVPGRQLMVAPTNVLQGLAMAGGLNQYARRSEVKVFRRQDGKTVVFPFDYDEVAGGRHLETNIELQKGDVILAP
jgi:polysaccharide biosynthesis/export protein